ncbi:NUDIX hydrolase [bacterium]|nr:MAG: NUDIX hydrolase [bacterium]
MKVDKIVSWEKIGIETIVAARRDKHLTCQHFKNPLTGEIQKFYGYVQHNWSVVLPIIDDGKVLTCRQYYQGVDMILQHLPGGNADFTDENPSDVAKRELFEETGYEAQEIIFLGIMPLSVRNSSTIASLFLALGCKKIRNAPIDENEIIEVIIEKIEDWIFKVFTEIREAPSREATFLALPWLRDKFGIDVNKIIGLALSIRTEKETIITSRS